MNYAGGLDLTSGPENLAPEQLTVAENVRFSKAGGCYTRLGFEQKADVGTSAKVDTIFTMPEYDVMFCKSGTKILQSLNGTTWYDIGVTRTASEREFFYAYGKSVFATNKTDSFLRIAVSTLATSITGASTDIVVRTGDGSNFTNGAAVIYIEGDEIDYNGVTTDTLGSVTNISASHAAGTIITQTSTPSGAPKGSCISELDGSLLVGGVSADPNVIHFSAPATEANPEFIYDFSANGAGKKRMPEAVNNLTKAAGIVVVGMDEGIDYAYAFDIDTGALLTRNLTKSHGIPNAFAVAYIENNTFAVYTGRRILLVVADADGVRIIDDPFKPKSAFDYAVRKRLQELDDDQALSFVHFDPTQRELSASVLKSSIAQELIANIDLGTWSIDTGKPFSCKTNFKFRVYVGADDDDKIYLENEGTTDNTQPIPHRIVSPIYTQDDKRISSDYLSFLFGGLINATGSFTLRIYVNGVLAITEEIAATDMISAGLMSLSTGVPIGSGTVGAETIGSSGTTPEAYAFTYPLEFLLSGERFQVEWEIYQAGDEGTSLELRDSRLDAETSGDLYLPGQ